REHDIADGDGIFAGLNVDIGDRCGAMMDNQVGELIGGETITVERMIITTHCAVVTILTAVVGYLDDAAHEDAAAKYCVPRGCSARVELTLAITGVLQPQKVLPHSTHYQIYDNRLGVKHNLDFHG